MTVRNLDRLLKPGSVALIGASRRADSIGAKVARNLFKAGFGGAIMPVNPREAAIEGVLAYPDIAALPLSPDLAVICTPPDTVPGLIAELGAHGCRAAVVITAGFHDQKGIDGGLRQAMLDAARPHLLRVLGPNSLGLMVPGIGLNASFGHLPPRPGGIAVVAQSGAVVTSLLDWAEAKGIGFSHLISIGDMADVDFGDLLDYLVADAGVAAVCLYVEAVTQARKFMSAARSAARQKPVVVIKAGRSEDGALAAARHTGATAGSDAVYDAAIRRAGMLRVAELDELFDAVETLATGLRVGGDRLAIVTNGGGMGVMAVDSLAAEGGRLAQLAPETVEKLDRVLPATWSRSNPIDIVGDAPPDRYAAALAAVLADPGTDAVLVVNCPTAVADSSGAAEALVPVLRARPHPPKPVLASWLGGSSAAPARALFSRQRIPSFETPGQAVRAFMHLVRYRRNQELLLEAPPSVSGEFTADLAGARALVADALRRGTEVLEGADALRLLGLYGIPTGPAERLQPAGSDAALPCLRAEAVEDPLFGPVLRFGESGPVHAQEDALALPPLNMVLAEETMRRSRIHRRLAEAPATAQAVAMTLIKLSQLVGELPEIFAATLDPLVPTADGVSAAQAKVVLKARPAGAPPRLAIRPYPRALESEVVLEDGRRFALRPIRPQDAPLIEDMVAGQSPEDLRLRFFHPIRRLPRQMVAKLTQIDYDREMALVAVGRDEAGRDYVHGVVRITSDPDNIRAEYAVMVLSGLKGQGLGMRLMQAIIAYARSRDIREIFGEVLAENTGMLHLCDQLGFTRRRHPEDPGIVLVSLDLTAAPDVV